MEKNRGKYLLAAVYDSGPITAAQRKLKIEGANKPKTRYFGFCSGFGSVERILYPYSSVIASNKIFFGYLYVVCSILEPFKVL